MLTRTWTTTTPTTAADKVGTAAGVRGRITGRVARRITAAAALAAGTFAASAAGTGGAQAAEVSVWDKVAACESSGDWTVNTGNGFSGGLQFTPSTWAAFGGTAYASAAHQATRAQQIDIAERVLKVQGPGAWPVCSTQAGLH